ncbi:MAG: pyridoxal-phosphate dependent enzyme [Candidatus Eisenbacteria bacterium]|nr:pyridoxal-phosphate dependent enzyme [Candidatus Eisenbacteria bacterium]
MNIHRMVSCAADRLRGRVRNTPLVRSDTLSELTGADVHLKLESLQHTGSFKYRGALNRLLALEDDARGRGVIAASTGNHGLAVLRAAAETGVSSEIWVPESADRGKVETLERRGAEVVVRGAECAQTEVLARAEAERGGRTFVSGYNDEHVIGGQGTVAVEILEALPRVSAVVASVGGGGLIAGQAGLLAVERPSVRVLGAYPLNSPAMYESVRAGRIVEARVEPTLSDATAGGVEPGSVTFEPCAELVAAWAGVDENEIAAGVRLLFAEGLVAEGAAGLAAAGAVAFAGDGAIGPGDVVCVIVCGRNVDPAALLRLVAGRGRPERA